MAVTVPDAVSFQILYVQMRAWDARAGNSFEAAVLANGKYGMGNIVTAQTFVPPGPPGPLLAFLDSFCLIPEPRVWLLLVWAGLLWALWVQFGRRRPSLGRPVAQTPGPNQRADL